MEDSESKVRYPYLQMPPFTGADLDRLREYPQNTIKRLTSLLVRPAPSSQAKAEAVLQCFRSS